MLRPSGGPFRFLLIRRPCALKTSLSSSANVGYDAYTDAAPGASLTQVRVGCFSAKADAEGLAQDVRHRVAADALVAPLSEEAKPTVCAERELGFVPPASWGLESSTADRVSFWLEAGGRRTITFDGKNWTLSQTEGALNTNRFQNGLTPSCRRPRLPVLTPPFARRRAGAYHSSAPTSPAGRCWLRPARLLWRSVGVRCGATRRRCLCAQAH